MVTVCTQIIYHTFFLFRDNKIIFEAEGETELNSAEVAATKAWFFKTLKDPYSAQCIYYKPFQL